MDPWHLGNFTFCTWEICNTLSMNHCALYFTFGQFFWTPGTAFFCATSVCTQHSFVHLDNSIETLALLCNVLHKWTQHFLVHSGNSLLYMEWCTQIDRWMGPMVKIGRSAQLTWHLPQSCQWPEIDATKCWCKEVGVNIFKGVVFLSCCLLVFRRVQKLPKRTKPAEAQTLWNWIFLAAVDAKDCSLKLSGCLGRARWVVGDALNFSVPPQK